MTRLFTYIIVFILAFSCLNAQKEKSFKKKSPGKTTEQAPRDLAPWDTVGMNQTPDTTRITKSKSSIDSTVTYFAEDSVRFKFDNRKMRLRGKARMNMKEQTLEAEIIEISLEESKLYANSAKDTAGISYGFPLFTDQGEKYAAEKIEYDFKTGKGVISLGETQMGEGFYFGEKIKRETEDVMFVKGGYYTTCDALEPHYHFGSPKMKIQAEEKVFLDPIIFYVEDLPVFIIPFGLFFPSKGGRQSGLIVPSFYFSQSRGVVFENFGFYWAASDYWDTQLKTDLYTKGGFLLKNSTRWVLRDVFSGNANLEYGKTRFDPDDDFKTNWSISLVHNHTISPSARINANVSLTTPGFYQNTSTNINQRITQNIGSRASYSKTFDNGSSFSVSFNRDQNIIDDTYSQNFPISYTLPNIYPLKKYVKPSSSVSWLRDVSIKYSSNLNYSEQKDLQDERLGPDGEKIEDTSFKITNRRLITHRPSISISPKFGYFTLSPSISFNANNYFRKLTRRYSIEDSTTFDSYESGIFTEYWYSLGLSLSTRVYGLWDNTKPLMGFVKPKWLGFKAFRHTYQPSFSFNFTPDFSKSNFGFYDRYYDPALEREVEYSRFTSDGGSHAPAALTQVISYSDLHSFEMKIAQPDSAEDVKLELLRLNFSTSYNIAADSLNFSSIRMSFRSPALNFINFSGNATFSVYDEEKTYNKKGEYTGAYHKVNRFLINSSKGLARLTSLSLSLSTRFSSQGISLGSSFSEPKAPMPDDSIALGQRFRARHAHVHDHFDIFGDSSPGYRPLSVPWSLNMGLSFSYSAPYENTINRTLNLRADLQITLTKTWAINASARYDLIDNELLTPLINLHKDLHCWELILNWTPVGINRGFYLKFGIKSSMLNDLKLEKRSSPLFR